MKRTILAALIALTPLAAQADDWIPLTSAASGHSWSFKKGSGEFTRTVEGTPVYAGLIQVRSPQNTFSYERNYVSLRDCIDGYGQVVTISTATGRVQYRNDFAMGGSSVAAQIGTVLCKLAALQAERDNGKSY